MDYYCPLTSILDQIASFMTVYLLKVTICTVTGHMFLKMCVKTQCLLQSTLIAKEATTTHSLPFSL